MLVKDLFASGTEEYIVLDGLDECLVGVIERFGTEPVLLYDTRKIIEKLQKDGLTEEEAVEYYAFNIAGGYFGERTPAFLIEDITHDQSNAPS